MGIKRRKYNVNSLNVLLIASAVKYYPPSTHEDLKMLHKVVVDSAAADYHKISVLYYIMLDLDSQTRKKNIALNFEKQSSLPRKYQIYMRGLWYLDRLEFEVRQLRKTSFCTKH